MPVYEYPIKCNVLKTIVKSKRFKYMLIIYFMLIVIVEVMFSTMEADRRHVDKRMDFWCFDI